MTDLTIFKNENFGEVRTILKNNEVWFVLNDICKNLEILNARDVKSRLEKGDVGTTDVTDSLGRMQATTIINEFALYECILLSRKPSAKQFRHWITHEVIPEIRKTGQYSRRPQSFKEALYLAYKQQEEIELLEKTKAWIGDKKTATAMNTASQKSKEIKKLQIELGKCKEYASIKSVEIKTKRKFDWKPLRNYCTSHELEMPKSFDANYGSVRTYPAEAWKEIYGIELEGVFLND